LRVALIALSEVMPTAVPGNDAPRFANLTTDEVRRAQMPAVFPTEQQHRDHPITVSFNDCGVMIGTAKNTNKFKERPKAMTELISNGSSVLFVLCACSAIMSKRLNWLQGSSQATRNS